MIHESPKVPLTCYYCYIPCYPTPTVPANWGGGGGGLSRIRLWRPACAWQWECSKRTHQGHVQHLSTLNPLTSRDTTASISPSCSKQTRRTGHQFCPFSIAKDALISRWATTRTVWRWTWSGRRLGNQNRGTGINRHVCRRNSVSNRWFWVNHGTSKKHRPEMTTEGDVFYSYMGTHMVVPIFRYRKYETLGKKKEKPQLPLKVHHPRCRPVCDVAPCFCVLVLGALAWAL